MNKLSREKQVAVVAALVEGNSMRAVQRLTGVAQNTVVKLLVDLGRACAKYQDEHLRGLTCTQIQCDEIWSFCYAKEKNVPDNLKGKWGYGDVWTWVAVCADTKLVPCWLVSSRDAGAAYHFMHDLKSRLINRVQLTTDGHKAYLSAVEDAFGSEIDYAMLVKMFGAPTGVEHHYSPPVCTGCTTLRVSGNPDPQHVSTSYAERQNLTMRMQMRRFTRLTNAFSKKVVNLEHAVALHYMHYNFCRIHQSLRVTPAMEAGVADHVWDLAEIVALLD
ncbi:MAG: IS1 family transposase [Verrucomicrobiia bacterium]|jgi:IS1 family transposase